MVKVAALLALVVLAACAQPAADSAPEWTAAVTKTLTFVPADDELHSLLVAADLAWEAAGVNPAVVVIAEPGTVGGIPVEWRTTMELIAKCSPDGRKTIGCSDMGGEGLLISSEASVSKLDLIARHEMGHAIREAGEVSHLDCDIRSSATMCDASTATEITSADTDFICASESNPCS
jgi:hypothetical protein